MPSFLVHHPGAGTKARKSVTAVPVDLSLSCDDSTLAATLSHGGSEYRETRLELSHV